MPPTPPRRSLREREGTGAPALCLRFNCQTTDAQTRVVASVLCPARDKLAFVFSVSLIGACGTPGGSPRQRRHELLSNSRGPLRKRAQGGGALAGAPILRAEQTLRIAAEAGKRLRSARDGLCGLLHVPRNCRFRRHAAWFGRTAARTCTWTVRPSLLRACALRRARPAWRFRASQAMRAGVCRPCSAAPGRSIRNPRCPGPAS